MTEDEAKTKVCCGPPHVAWAQLALSPRTRLQDPSTFDVCVGSACMAWRWDGPAVRIRLDLNVAGGADELSPPERPNSGFCGLAGAPQ